MKKIKLFIIILISLFVINVKADMGPPSIVPHKVMVTNKSGAQCYEYNEKGVREKTKDIIPYKTTLEVSLDIDGSYIYVSNEDKYYCYVKYSDVSAIDQNFKIKNENAEKITATKAIIFPSGGVNLRKGPSVTYSRITTIPQYTIVTLTYRAGSQWYYTSYNGNSGWITGMNGYVAREDNKVLYSINSVKIYDAKGKNIGTIPANTPIEKYLVLDYSVDYDYRYYVIYNNIKGYISDYMYIKIDSPGKIKLTEDYPLEYDDNGNPTKKIAKGKEFEYTMVDWDNGFYVPARKESLYFKSGEFEYISKANISVKKSGYLGEGLFGEKKVENNEPQEIVEEEIPVIPKQQDDESMSMKDIIIIGLLGGIFLALTSLVIIKLVNNKKTTTIEKVDKEEKINVVTDNEIEKAREVIRKELDKNEPALKKSKDETED